MEKILRITLAKDQVAPVRKLAQTIKSTPSRITQIALDQYLDHIKWIDPAARKKRLAAFDRAAKTGSGIARRLGIQTETDVYRLLGEEA